MIASVVVVGLVGAVALSAAAGSSAGSMPGVALGSTALLMAERVAGLFAIWMAMVVIVIRAFRDQLPVEISGRGVRYADAEEVQTKTASVDEAMRGVEVEMRWMRAMVQELRTAEDERRRREGDG